MENIKLSLDKEKFNVLQRKKFVFPTAEIYGGVQGFYDYGPNGEKVMTNIINEWRKFFVLNEGLLTIECPIITPERVLKASGHVDRFNDYLVKDVVTGDSYRADHLVAGHIELLLEDKAISPERKKELEDLLQQIDNFGEKELGDIIRKFQMKSPILNNEVTSPKPFNLMFEASIGPSGNVKGYLRPETAQGIFVNYKRLFDESQGKLPFGVAQVGISCRNEISPRSGLLRVREFKMAEIEYFLDPEDKTHSEFSSLSHLNINMFTSPNQISGKSVEMINLGEAVKNGTIANETLGYFMGRIYLFLMKVGIKPEYFRFRQHMPNEMAHYACDCWDAECLTSYGWIECVGCADRSAYDLNKHTEHSGIKLVAQRQLSEPKKVMRTFCKPVMSHLGKTFKKNAGVIGKYIESLSGDDSKDMVKEIKENKKKTVTLDNVDFDITENFFEFIEKEEVINIEEFVPNVIEPSFGLGRIFYCTLEQNFAIRESDSERTYFTIPTSIAPYQFSVLPLSSNEEFVPLTKQIKKMFINLGIYCFVDTSSASIGKRYARTDTIGIPFGITIDFDSIRAKPASVTMRERDSMKQIRVKVEELSQVARQLVDGTKSWDDLLKTFPIFEEQEN